MNTTSYETAVSLSILNEQLASIANGWQPGLLGARAVSGLLELSKGLRIGGGEWWAGDFVLYTSSDGIDRLGRVVGHCGSSPKLFHVEAWANLGSRYTKAGPLVLVEASCLVDSLEYSLDARGVVAAGM